MYSVWDLTNERVNEEISSYLRGEIRDWGNDTQAILDLYARLDDMGLIADNTIQRNRNSITIIECRFKWAHGFGQRVQVSPYLAFARFALTALRANEED